MPRRTAETIVLCTLSIGLVVLIFFAPSTGPAARNLVIKRNAPSLLEDTLRENEALRAEVARLDALSNESRREGNKGITASVYSTYPFGSRSELTVDAGSVDGITKGDAALFQGILIGKVALVSSHAASVITIFDNSFSLAVRVASSGVNGLLTGGNDPMVTSMPKNANVAHGDVVISAVPGLPYGLTLGVLGTSVLSSNSLFLEAPLMTSYGLQDIESVTIIHIP